MIKHKKNYKKALLVGGLLAIIALAGLYSYKHDSKAVTSNNSSTKVGQSNNSVSQPIKPSTNTANTAKQPGDKYPTNSVSNSNADVITPSGTFVNNHNPKTTDSMLSICSTTPNIQCQITFKKDGVIHRLPQQTTDNNGNTVWSWTPKSVGLTTGNWQIVVTASSGTKSASVTDPIALEVQQ